MMRRIRFSDRTRDESVRTSIVVVAVLVGLMIFGWRLWARLVRERWGALTASVYPDFTQESVRAAGSVARRCDRRLLIRRPPLGRKRRIVGRPVTRRDHRAGDRSEDRQAFEQIAALELLPPQTALASMHIIVMLLLLVAPMALAVVGDLLLHAAPCPRLIGFHLRAPVGCGLWLHAGHG